MLGMEARLRNRDAELRQYLHQFCPGLGRPQGRFFSQAIRGILLSGSMVVARWLRFIRDRCRHRFWRHKRLLHQLHHGRCSLTPVLNTYQHQWGRRVEADTPLIVDLSDLPRPRARRLKYLSLVRDGSEGRLVNGYWCLEIYALWNRHRITPLLLRPYSHEDPQMLSENAVILRAVDQVMQATGGRGVLVMDRGADRDRLLIPWIDADRRFVVCLRGDRHLLLENGVHVEASLLAERLLQHSAGRRVVWAEVRLPERPANPLWLVAKATAGKDRPLLVLSRLRVETVEQAERVLRYYRWRWSCEEAARFLKSALGLERMALRVYESMPRLLLLATLAMGLLSWLGLRQPGLARWLCGAGPGRHAVKFVYYRLLLWWVEQISPANRARCPPRAIQNG